MEKNLKKAIAASVVAMTALTAVPVTANADSKYTDTFMTAIDVDGMLINNAALVAIESENTEELDVSVAVVADYSAEELSALTGTSGDPFVISCSEMYGIKYNPETTAVMFYCDEYDEWGDVKVRSHNSDDYLGQNKTGKKRVYWERNTDCLKAGTGIFGCHILMFGDDNAEVEIFGRKYTLTAEMTMDAPELVPELLYTEETESETPVTAPALPNPPVQETAIGVLSNLDGLGTDIAETSSTSSEKSAETTTETRVTETTVTSSSSAVTTTAETTVSTVSETVSESTAETVKPADETAPVQPAPIVQETETDESEQAEISETDETDGEWKVVQVMLPTETNGETAETETGFPILPALAGNVAAILIGFLVKIKFF